MNAMHVLSAAEMKACDRATSEHFGVASIDLMRAAAAAVAGFARQAFPSARRLTVLCGRGNNGGDGMMTARLLAAGGLEVTTLLLGAPEGFNPDVVTAWSELLAGAAPGTVHVVETAADLAVHNAALKADLLIDALVGTGFKPPLKGLAKAALEWARASDAAFLSLDLPSGWAADTTQATALGQVFPSDAVITFTAPKPAHVFAQLTRRWNQPVVVAPIGSPPEAIVSTLGFRWAGAAMELIRSPRAAAANKGNFGHVLVVGGSVGRSGAPSMSALAALRSGAGLVSAAVPAAVLAQVSAIAPELMTIPLVAAATDGISHENLAPDALAALIAGKSVLAIGPGLGQAAETVKFVTGLLSATKIPAVIDADALNILAAKPVLLAKLAKGRIAVNTTGNPGMAKGGSGDLLTGLVAGLLAQHIGDPARAVEAAVYLHGLAADLAVRQLDEHTLLATDGLQQLSRAFRFDSRGRNDYVWLQGLPVASMPDVCSNEANR